MISFSDFATVCYESDVIRGRCKKYEFPNRLAILFMRGPETEQEDLLDQKDEYYPFLYPNDKNHTAPRKILRGEMSVSSEDASRIRDCLDASGFLDAVEEIKYSWEAIELFKRSFEQIGVQFEEDEDVGEKLVSVFKEIICDIASGAFNENTNSTLNRNRSLQEVRYSGVYLDRSNHKLVVGSETIEVSPILYSEDIRPEEQKYIAALLGAYASRMGLESVTIEEIKRNGFFYDDLNHQRHYFFDAASAFRAIRDAFTDGEKEFEIMKDEAYEGIREIYISDFADGFARLNGVLSKVTSTTFDKTLLGKLTRLIGNSEKKGLCHMLVEDGKIETWILNY